jgi:ankyrin repeat protein
MKRQILLSILLMGTFAAFGMRKQTIYQPAPKITQTQINWQCPTGIEGVEPELKKTKQEEADELGKLLVEAANKSDIKQVQNLIAQGANLNVMGDINTPFTGREKALTTAARLGDDKIVQVLLDAGGDIDTQDESGKTALSLATWNKHINTVKLLLNKKANPNLQDLHGWTPLMNASLRSNNILVKLLLDADADPMQQDDQGQTALMIQQEKPALQRNQKIIEILEKAGREALLGEDV